MKKLLFMLSLVFTTALLFGCGETDNSTVTQNQLPASEFNKTWTLQGKIMDALTGAPLGNDTSGNISFYLIQGDNDRGATKLHNDPNDPLFGEYSVSGIPADAVHTGGAVFKVIVKKPGYQDFAAYVNFDAALQAGVINFDGTMNMIGNIYLFPIGTMAGDVTIRVFDTSGTPIPNAQILVQQDVFNNAAVAITSSTTTTGNTDRLGAAGGLYPSVSATTDASGVATISGTTLVLGGRYRVFVAEILFNGQILEDAFTPFIVSTANLPVVVNLNAAASLFATSASNQVPGTIDATGVLTITFNQPILLSTTVFNAVASAGTLTTVVGGVDTGAEASGALSADGLTLTITPNFATAPTATELGATVTYTYGGTIILKSTQAASGVTFNGTPATDLENISTGDAVSRSVQMVTF